MRRRASCAVRPGTRCCDWWPAISAVDQARQALNRDRTIDIVTTGARSGRQRVTEIWFTNIDGRIVICGTPGARHWLANLAAHPEFEFRFKESLELTVPARARVVRDPAERSAIMSARATAWYRDQGFGIDELVARSPIVDVHFLGEFQRLNRPA